jgi:hypothetical protein
MLDGNTLILPAQSLSGSPTDLLPVVPNVPTVPTPSFILPRGRGGGNRACPDSIRGGGLNVLNRWQLSRMSGSAMRRYPSWLHDGFARPVLQRSRRAQPIRQRAGCAKDKCSVLMMSWSSFFDSWRLCRARTFVVDWNSRSPGCPSRGARLDKKIGCRRAAGELIRPKRLPVA